MMGDDERERMEAALAILGMANSVPTTSSSPATTTTASQQSPNGLMTSRSAHVPVATMPRPQHGAVASAVNNRHTAVTTAAGTAAQPAAVTMFHSIQQTAPAKHVVLPKVPRNIFLRSRLESKIARNEAAVLEKASTPLAVKGAELSPRKRRKKGKKQHQQQQHENGQGHYTTQLTGSDVTVERQRHLADVGHKLSHAEQLRQHNRVNSEQQQQQHADQSITLTAAAAAAAEEIIHRAQNDKLTKQAAALPSYTTSHMTNNLERSQEQQQFISSSVPKIVTTTYGNLSDAKQLQSAQGMVAKIPHLKRRPSSDGISKSLRPNLTLNIGSKVEHRMPAVSYSPISPADSQQTVAYTVVDTPTLRTLPRNPMQSEPLDLSKDTRAATVPLMQLVSPGVNDMRNLSLFSSMLQSADGSSVPVQYVSVKDQLAVRDGKLVLVATPELLYNDQISSPVNQSPGAIVTNPGALLSNPAAYGMQLVQDKQSGHALLLPSPQIQQHASTKENPFIPRHNSYPSLSSLVTASQLLRGDTSLTKLSNTSDQHSPTTDNSATWSRTVAATISPKQTTGKLSPTAAAAAAKQTRDQSSLPPKKRKFFEQNDISNSNKAPSTPISPKSIASTISSFTDDGYHTLKEDTVSAAVSAPAHIIAAAPDVTSGSMILADNQLLGMSRMEHARLVMSTAFQAQQISQLAPLPRMSTGLSDAQITRTAQALLLPRPPLTKQLAENHHPHIVQSLPVNLDHVESPPMTPLGSAAAKESIQELYTQKLYEEYQRSVREGSDVRPSKSPFQHFRPARIRRSNSTKVSVDLTSGYNWKSTVTAKMQLNSNKAIKREMSSPGSEKETKHNPRDTDTDTDAVKSQPQSSQDDIEKESEKNKDVSETRRDVTSPVVDEKPSADLLEKCRKSGLVDEDGDLPIHIAVVHENVAAVEKLLHMMRIASINVDHLNIDRQTPLHIAVITKNETILSCLLQAGSNPNIPDRKGFTGIHLAVKHNSKKCLLSILQESVIQPDLNAKNYEGYTALHMSVLQHSAEFANLLLLAGASLDLQDNKSGRTALFHAAETRQFNIASALLNKGANVNVTSYAGTTAAQAANGRGHSDLVALLIKYGADVSSNIRDSDVKPHSTSRSSTPKYSVYGKDKHAFKTNRTLRRMGSTGDLTFQDPLLQHLQERTHQAHSLDMDITPSDERRSPITSQTRGNDLRIVLPQMTGGIAASMPLSPSALGLATTKRLPMIPPMQAKSLPDDTVSTGDVTQTTTTSSTSTSSSAAGRYMLSNEQVQRLAMAENGLRSSLANNAATDKALIKLKDISKSVSSGLSLTDKMSTSKVAFAIPTAAANLAQRRTRTGVIEPVEVQHKRRKIMRSPDQIANFIKQASPLGQVEKKPVESLSNKSDKNFSPDNAYKAHDRDGVDKNKAEAEAEAEAVISSSQDINQSESLKESVVSSPMNYKVTSAESRTETNMDERDVSTSGDEIMGKTELVKKTDDVDVNVTNGVKSVGMDVDKPDADEVSSSVHMEVENANQSNDIVQSSDKHGESVLDPSTGQFIAVPQSQDTEITTTQTKDSSENSMADNTAASNTDSNKADSKTDDSNKADSKTDDGNKADSKTDGGNKADSKTDDGNKADSKTDDGNDSSKDRTLVERRRQFSKQSSDGSVELSQSFLDSLEMKDSGNIVKQPDEQKVNDNGDGKTKHIPDSKKSQELENNVNVTDKTVKNESDEKLNSITDESQNLLVKNLVETK